MRRWFYFLILVLLLMIPLLPIPEPAAQAPATPTATPTPQPTPSPTPQPTVQPQEKMIALTFDDGPGTGTLRILNALEDVNGKGTFCMVGNRVRQYPGTVRRVARQGSEIATHSFSHPNLARISPERLRLELKDSMRAIYEIAGVRPQVLRPPYGSISDDVRRAGREMDLVIANWNIDTMDWKNRDADAIYRHIMENARDGAIVLCHDIYPETAAAVERAIADLSARGYRLVTVSELLKQKKDGGMAGQVYYSA